MENIKTVRKYSKRIFFAIFILSLPVFFSSFVHTTQADWFPFLTVSATSVVQGGTYRLTADSNPSMQYGCWVELTAESVASQTQPFGNVFYSGAVTWDSIPSGPVGVYRYDLVCQLNEWGWTLTHDTIMVTVTAQTVGTITVTSNITGASYTLTGQATLRGSGLSTTFTNQPTGMYTITWDSVAGYTAPTSSAFALTDGGTINFSGNYTSSVPTINVHF